MFCIRFLAEHLYIFTNLPEPLSKEVNVVSEQLQANKVETFAGNLTVKEMWNWYRLRGAVVLRLRT